VKNEKIIYVTKIPAQTKKLGFLLAQAILENGSGNQARVLALRGDLGAGKTNFTQGFAQGLGVKETINSPTFVILRKYDLEKNYGNFKMFYHIDCYRLDSDKDLLQLGIEDISKDPANIVAVEWPDIAKAFFPKKILTIEFETLGANERRIAISEK
jgi:tRNA threonylcarbamoyladenosine biosynthesis protein TsaE